MALFQASPKEALRKLANKEYASTEERDEMLVRLVTADGLRARDVVWMLFRPDRALRDTAVKILQKVKDPDTTDLFIGECTTKPEAAVRAAAGLLFGLGVPGVEARLLQLASTDEKETQDSVRRILLEAPATKTLEPVLWQLATTGPVEERVQFLARLGSAQWDERALPKWIKLARDPEKPLRDKALEVLASRAPAAAVGVLVEQLPLAGYATQQIVVEGLTKTAATAGPEFIDRILPLIAAGEPGTRSAVLKLLLSLPDRKSVVRRYINFSKSLAGWARDRALESMRAFEDDLLEPTIELLADPDDTIRASAMVVAASFDDPRIVPAAIRLLKDPDWWIRIMAIETLGRLKHPDGVPPLIEMLNDPEARWSAVEALGRIGDVRALNPLGKLLGDPSPDIRIEALQALAHFKHPQVLQVFEKVAASDPVRAVRARAIDMAEEVALQNRATLSDARALRAAALTAKAAQGDPKLHALLIATRNQGASDFHLSVAQPPIVRIAHDLLRAQAEPFTPEQTKAMLREILTDAQMERLESEQQLDFCYYIPQAGRYRANIFIDHKGYNGVFRVIPEKPPTIHDIGLPPALAEIADYHQGLVLICGPSGSGKSTTLAALVNLFNETRHDHVLTLEDPVEFVHPFKNCLVNQREVGSHTSSFARALRAALREDPDVIVIGELRDNETVSLALTAAETGHIVLATLNSTSAPKAIDRIIGSFPADEQPQIRTGLSESLKYVIAQRLLPGKERHKQVACFEILKGTSNVASMIRDEKTFQIVSAMQIGRSQGMQPLDDALKELVKRGQITGETAYLAAQKKEDFEPLVPAEFLRAQAFV